MKKDTLIGAVVLVAAAILIIGYVLLQPAPAKAPGAVADTSGLPAGSYTEHATYYDISATYATSTPLSSLSPTADSSAVALMKNFVARTISQFKTDGNFANLTARDKEILDGRKETLNIVYLIASSRRTVSYIFTVYRDTLGAHGNTNFHTFTFDTRTGALLDLPDIFKSPAYLEALSALSRAGLPAVIGEGAEANTIAGGTTPEEKNFRNFFFDNKDFVILFDPYAVAPYAAGPQTLRIPLSSLSPILKPDYRQ